MKPSDHLRHLRSAYQAGDDWFHSKYPLEVLYKLVSNTVGSEVVYAEAAIESAMMEVDNECWQVYLRATMAGKLVRYWNRFWCDWPMREFEDVATAIDRAIEICENGHDATEDYCFVFRNGTDPHTGMSLYIRAAPMRRGDLERIESMFAMTTTEFGATSRWRRVVLYKQLMEDIISARLHDDGISQHVMVALERTAERLRDELWPEKCPTCNRKNWLNGERGGKC